MKNLLIKEHKNNVNMIKNIMETTTKNHANIELIPTQSNLNNNEHRESNTLKKRNSIKYNKNIMNKENIIRFN